MNSNNDRSGMPTLGHALVVDDDNQNRVFVAEALRRGGYEVIEAVDGIEGMARYHEREKGYFNIIVSDWVMPRLMGTSMVRSIRRHNGGQRILMMSSDDKAVRLKLKEFCITDVKVLYKSFTGEELLKEVLNVAEV